MIWVSADDVIALHSKIIKKTGGIDGVRDRSGLEAAVAAPLQSFGGEDFYPTTIDKIARLGYQLLLQWNGYRLVLNRGELADMFIAIADGSAGEIELLDWINKRIHR